MIDSHCHLDLPALADNIDSVLQCAKQKGVNRIMAPGTTVSSWKKLQRISDSFAHLLPIDTALGLHPYFLQANADNAIALLKQNVDLLEHSLTHPHSSVKAIGEAGLDGHINTSMALQKSALDAQLNIAASASLPIILHHRKSHHLLFEALKAAKFTKGGVIHAFSGSIDVAKRYIERGFMLGIGGTITYERAGKTRDTVSYLLKHYRDWLLLETDAPDMPMRGRQGQPNKPEYIGEVVSTLQTLGGESEESVIGFTSANYARLFLS